MAAAAFRLNCTNHLPCFESPPSRNTQFIFAPDARTAIAHPASSDLMTTLNCFYA